MLQIDGAFGEGGGQIIRTSLSLSAITQQPFEIFNVRLNRKPKPKLRPQHVMAAKAIAHITNGKLIDAEIGSDHFTFNPGKVTAGTYEFDIGTAGSAILVAQTIIPVLLHAEDSSIVKIIGGTSLHQSPSYDYFNKIFLTAIKRFGATVKCRLIRSGYYPRGGGVIEVTINPSKLYGCIEWHKNSKNNAIIRLANLPMHIALREEKILQQHGLSRIKIIPEIAPSPGNVVTIWQAFRGSTELGVRGKLAEKVAEKAYQNFTKESGDVDIHLADQLLLYAALAQNQTKYKTRMITEHVRTNAYVISKFLKTNIRIVENEVVINDCTGKNSF